MCDAPNAVRGLTQFPDADARLAGINTSITFVVDNLRFRIIHGRFARMASRRSNQIRDIVSAHLSDQAKRDLDTVCAARGMTIKGLMGRLIEWFIMMDDSERAIMLGQVEEIDVRALAEIVSARRSRRASRK